MLILQEYHGDVNELTTRDLNHIKMDSLSTEEFLSINPSTIQRMEPETLVSYLKKIGRGGLHFNDKSSHIIQNASDRMIIRSAVMQYALSKQYTDRNDAETIAYKVCHSIVRNNHDDESYVEFIREYPDFVMKYAGNLLFLSNHATELFIKSLETDQFKPGNEQCASTIYELIYQVPEFGKRFIGEVQYDIMLKLGEEMNMYFFPKDAAWHEKYEIRYIKDAITKKRLESYGACEDGMDSFNALRKSFGNKKITWDRLVEYIINNYDDIEKEDPDIAFHLDWLMERIAEL